jgi:hypothetical protein
VDRAPPDSGENHQKHQSGNGQQRPDPVGYGVGDLLANGELLVIFGRKLSESVHQFPSIVSFNEMV